MILPVTQEKQRLDNVFLLIEQLPHDDEILSHWAKYLCVLTSGFLEGSLRLILQNYSLSHADESISRFISSRLKGLTNLNDEKIGRLLGEFNSTWRDTFYAIRTPEQKDSIDSVLANRHLIAHGRSIGLTLAPMKRYYVDISKVVKIIDEECVNK